MSVNFVTRFNCPVCGGRDHETLVDLPFSEGVVWDFLKKYYSGRVSKALVDFNYWVVKCRDCTLVFQKHILSDSNMALLYGEWISDKESLDKKNARGFSNFSRYAFEIERLFQFHKNKLPSDVKVLEFGMGWGFWSRLARAYNLKVFGFELSESRIAHAEGYGVQIIRDLAAVEPGFFDCVYSNQVFEHLPDPSATLVELSRVLRSGGVVHIQVPDGSGLARKMSRPDWVPRKDAAHPLEHINGFNRKALSAMARQAGLKVVPPPYYLKGSTLFASLKWHARYLSESFSPKQVYLRKD